MLKQGNFGPLFTTKKIATIVYEARSAECARHRRFGGKILKIKERLMVQFERGFSTISLLR